MKTVDKLLDFLAYSVLIGSMVAGVGGILIALVIKTYKHPFFLAVLTFFGVFIWALNRYDNKIHRIE